MTTAFLLGSTPHLSLAELESVFYGNSFEKDGSIVYSNTSFHQVKESFPHLGGSVRAFEILEDDLQIFDILPAIKSYISNHAENGKKMKLAFFAQHPAFAKRNFMKWMQEIKSFSKTKNISLRVANRGDQNLDCNAVDKEKLLQDGNAEFAIAEKNEKFVLMRTIAVQEVWKFITRDIKKPVRDMQVGMMPPKLARMMINLARTNGVLPSSLYDPFCGTGTVLIEAMDLKIPVMGSDLSEKMVEASTANTSWFSSVVQVEAPKVFQKDATERCSYSQLSLFLPHTTVVSEGYLGHIYSTPLTDDQIKKEVSLLLPLYTKFLQSMTINTALSTFVFGFPFWKTQKGKYSLFAQLFENTPEWKSIKTFRYIRDDQVVGREIVIAERRAM